MKKYTKTWETFYEGNKIVVTNWWNFKGDTEAKLFINDQFIGLNCEFEIHPYENLFHYIYPIREIKEIKVYFRGFFSAKLAIEVNGEFILKDKLNVFDRLAVKNWDRINSFFDKLEIQFIKFFSWYWQRKRRLLLERNQKILAEARKNFETIDKISSNQD